jgi:hypothetical protein
MTNAVATAGGAMTPETFRAKWHAAAPSETAGAQEHFIDLCRLLALPTPTEADPSRTWYRFEQNVLKLDGRPGRAEPTSPTRSPRRWFSRLPTSTIRRSGRS